MSQQEGEHLKIFSHLKSDLAASVIVFLVAMPLCLGIAMASGAPLFSGLISGIVGGLVVGSLSGSALGVSGPAAGLAVIVLAAIQDLGGYEIFLLAVVFSGLLQIGLGYLKAGVIAHYFPSSVISGMLAGIGIILFLKQIPHAVGYDENPEGVMSFSQPDNYNTFTELIHMLDYLSFGPIIITAVSLIILIAWETKFFKQYKVFTLIQGPLVAVIVGIFLNVMFRGHSDLALVGKQIVSIPAAESLSGFFSNFKFPDFNHVFNPQVYFVGVVIAIVGSLETLLCVEASDKQDPQKRVTPTNRELKAQGVGNVLSGLIGGLPITQVIVRSSVNVQAGGKTKLSAIAHGFIILVSILLIPNILNLIPLSTLAAILFVVGYKLSKPSLYKKLYKQGAAQFGPFLVTIIGIVFTDLLTGIAIGLFIAGAFILYNAAKIPIVIDTDSENPEDNSFVIELTADMNFLKKASLIGLLSKIPDKAHVTIDASKTHYMHYDIMEIIENFEISAQSRDIKVLIIGLNNDKSKNKFVHYKVRKEKLPSS